jgi:hypothetical protein
MKRPARIVPLPDQEAKAKKPQPYGPGANTEPEWVEWWERKIDSEVAEVVERQAFDAHDRESTLKELYRYFVHHPIQCKHSEYAPTRTQLRDSLERLYAEEEPTVAIANAAVAFVEALEEAGSPAWKTRATRQKYAQLRRLLEHAQMLDPEEAGEEEEE